MKRACQGRPCLVRQRAGQGVGTLSVEDDVSINGETTVLVGKNRIEIEFLDIRLSLGQGRQGEEGLLQSGQVNGGLTAMTGEQRKSTDFTNHASGVLRAERRYPERDIFEHLDMHPTQAKHDERTELRIRCQADDDLNSRSGHRLNRDAFDGCMCLADGGHDVIKRAPDGGFCGQIELHATDIAFMRDVG